MDLYGTWDAGNDSGRSTPVPGDHDAPASSDGGQALQRELEQMGSVVSGMGKTLGSYWGGFRRQSAAALKQSQQYASTATKDLTPYLDKAKQELDKLSEQARASAQAGQAASLAGDTAVTAEGASVAPADDAVVQHPVAAPDASPSSPKAGSSSDRDGDRRSSSTSSSSPTMTAAAFFGRLQTQLSSNPNFQSFQHNLVNMQDQLRSTVDFSRIDLHEAQKRAESAMNQGEKYFKVASKELTDLFGEAVRIVPPSGSVQAGKGGSRAGADQRKKEAAAAAAGRKETLLYKLRSDPSVLSVNPASPPALDAGARRESDMSASQSHADTSEAFAHFKTSIDNEGGLEAGKWKLRIEAELADENYGPVLSTTINKLVPSEMPMNDFWVRYFYRMQQIEEDEARRREILEGVAKNEEEDFDWDMEEDDADATVHDVPEAKDNDVAAASNLDKGKGKAAEASHEDDEVAIPTPKLGQMPASPASRPQNLDVKSNTRASTPSGSDVEESWGMSPVGGSPGARTISEDVVPKGVPAQSVEPPSVLLDERKTSTTSTRNSSEEGTTSSFDIVSATSGDPPGSPEAHPAVAPATKSNAQPTAKAADEDEDSDWE